MTVELDRYTFVLLRRGPKAFDYSEKELEELQRGRMSVEIMTWLTKKGSL